MPTAPTLAVPARPAVDEWGLYDPEQAGLAALFARLATTTPAPLPADALVRVLDDRAAHRPREPLFVHRP